MMLKKCLLCECEIETLATNWSDQLASLSSSRSKLYRDLADFFRTIRSTCQSISETNEQFNDKLFSDNQISKLPTDTFDNILVADEFNYVKLKVRFLLDNKLNSNLLIASYSALIPAAESSSTHQTRNLRTAYPDHILLFRQPNRFLRKPKKYVDRSSRSDGGHQKV